MSYYLGLKGKKITEIRALSNVEYQTYTNSSKCLFEFSRDQQLFSIVYSNFDDFKNALESYAESYANNPQKINSLIMDQIVLKLNKHLLNYLSSIRCFLDHTHTKLKKKYDSESLRYQRFDEVRKKNYDNIFSYRFLSKLRNYSQHCGMPIEEIKLESVEDPPYSNIIKHSFHANFNRDHLLEFDLWGARIKKELSQMPLKFEVFPHVATMMKCIETIDNFLITEDLPALFKSLDFIDKLIEPLQDREGIPCIMRYLKIHQENGETKNMTIEFVNIPWHIIGLVRKYREQNIK